MQADGSAQLVALVDRLLDGLLEGVGLGHLGVERGLDEARIGGHGLGLLEGVRRGNLLVAHGLQFAPGSGGYFTPMGHGPPPDGAEVDEGRFLAVLRDAVAALEGKDIPYLLMGGIGSATLGRPRGTNDIDIFVRPESARLTLDVYRSLL